MPRTRRRTSNARVRTTTGADPAQAGIIAAYPHAVTLNPAGHELFNELNAEDAVADVTRFIRAQFHDPSLTRSRNNVRLDRA